MKSIVYSLLVGLFVLSSCNDKGVNPVVKTVLVSSYEISFGDSFISKILRRKDGYLLEQEVIGRLNDTTMLSILYDSQNQTLQKKYYFTLANGLAYKSIDSVSDSQLIAEYAYDYNVDSFCVGQQFTGKIYSDFGFQVPVTNVTGSILNEIQNNNTVQSLVEKTYTGKVNFTEKQVFIYSFLPYENVAGVQNFSQGFKGKSNKNLIDSIEYTYFKDNVLLESGTVMYSYVTDSVSKRILRETQLYTSDNKDKAPVETIRNISYPTK
jgi:hypothetical protein